MKKIKFGLAALVGRPNTGKSTLLNAIMQQKVAITSPLPQTTRKNMRVIYGDERGKIVFSDTPGILSKVADLVGKRVNLEVPKEVAAADVIVMLVDISRPKSEEENRVIGLIRKSQAKKILVYNKLDLATGKSDYLPEYNYLEEEFDKTIFISALKEKHIKGLLEMVFELLGEESEEKVNKLMAGMEEGPVISMQSEEYLGELIREKAYLFLRKEVPYSIHVQVEKVEEKKNIIVVSAKLLTTADRYKKMIIGKDGRKIKQIGSVSRKEMELMSGKKVFLSLQVEVDKHWPERVIK